MGRRDFGTIFQRKGSSSYYVRFYVGRGRGRRRIERRAGRTREIAKKKLREVQTLLDRMTPVAELLNRVFGDAMPGSMTFNDARTPYLEYVSLRLRKSTHEGYSNVLRVVGRSVWAEHYLSDVTAAEIAHWLDARRRDGRSTQTLNNYLVAISGLFRWAKERGLVESNPVRKLRWYPQGPGREVYLTSAEARALIASCDKATHDIVLMALSTGMRRGELLTLRWSEIDLVRRTITITVDAAKSHRLRVIPMTDALHKALTRRARGRRAAGDLVFTGPSGGSLAKATLAARLRRAVQSCSAIPDSKKQKVTLHTLRHTAASLMVAQGRPIFDVAKILGHRDVSTTMRYAHFAPEAGRETITALGKSLDMDSEEGNTPESGEA